MRLLTSGILVHWHSIVDVNIHEEVVADCVYGGYNDVLNFGVFVPQHDRLDGLIPLNPAAFSFKLGKRQQQDLLKRKPDFFKLFHSKNHTLPDSNSHTPGLLGSWGNPMSPRLQG